MAWNVKNEMPIGSSTRGTAIGATCASAQQRVDVVGEEVGVLEDAEHDEVDRDRERRAAAPAAGVPCARSTAIAIQ